VKKRPEAQSIDFKTNMNAKKFYGVIFKNTPKPIMYIAIGFFFYAAINFVLFMQATEGGNPDIINGTHVLSDHGSVVRVLSDSEYLSLRTTLSPMKRNPSSPL